MASELILCCRKGAGSSPHEHVCQSFILKQGVVNDLPPVISKSIVKGLLAALMSELCGSSRGLMLVQEDVPETFIGRTYADLIQHMTLTKCMIPLGLYRKKVENPAWRLRYVVTNPPGDELLLPSDKVYLIRDGS